MAQRPSGDHSKASPQLAAARSYASRGWRVIPLHGPTKGGGCTCGKADCGPVGKHPRTKNGLKDASASEAVLNVWWGQQWARANVGIVTGGRSGLVVLDIDTRHGGAESLSVLQERYGALPETLRVATGGGGEHWYYQHPGGDVLLRNVAGLDDLSGLDIRGDGGYVVAPPSWHKSGAKYEWVDEATPVAPLPDWLLELLQKPRADYDVRGPRLAPDHAEWAANDTGQYWLDKALAQAYEGNRNATGFWLACQLRDAGLSHAETENWLATYAARVPGSGYSEREALASVRQAYTATPREAARNTAKVSGDYQHYNNNSYTSYDYGNYSGYDSNDESGGDYNTDSTDSTGNDQGNDSQGPRGQQTRQERSDAKRRKARFTFMTDEEVEALPPPEWLLGGMLVANTLSVVFGEYGSAKSFLVLDWALSIATGMSWMGHPVKQGAVVYIAGEGIGGMGKRIRAWKQQHGWTGGATGLHLLGTAPHLLSPEDVLFLRDAMRALPVKPSLVVIDTLARSMTGGDENSAQDMGRAVAAAESIRVEFGCHVLLVHHKPNGAAKTRGSNALPGAAYTLVDVVRDNDTIIVNCPKQKDAAEFDRMYAKLLTVCIDEETLETSCVLTPTAARGRWNSDPQRMTRSAENVLNLLKEQAGQQLRFNDIARMMEEQFGAVKQTVANALAQLKLMGKVVNDTGIWRVAYEQV